MGKRGTANKGPKAVELARAKLQAVGSEVTGEALKSHLTAAELNKLGNAMRSALNEEKKKEYKDWVAKPGAKHWPRTPINSVNFP